MKYWQITFSSEIHPKFFPRQNFALYGNMYILYTYIHTYLHAKHTYVQYSTHVHTYIHSLIIRSYYLLALLQQL